MILIGAITQRVAEMQAQLMGLQPNQWQYLHSVAQVQAHRDGVILLARGWWQCATPEFISQLRRAMEMMNCRVWRPGEP